MIYFAQPAGGGPIKLGVSEDAHKRVLSIGTHYPHGFEMLATIPGGVVREQVLLRVMAAHCLKNEWLRSCPPVWRVVLEAIEKGDLHWLPHGPGRRAGRDAAKEAVAMFGDARAAVDGIGVHHVTWRYYKESKLSAAPTIEAGIAFERLRRSGSIPEFLAV